MRLPLVMLVFALSYPLAGYADSLRCGSSIVSEGSTKVETLAKCGEPVSRDVRTEVDTIKVKEKGDALEISQERAVVRTIEEWTYNFGPNHFLQHVTFVDGRLRDVRSGDYGF